MVPDEQAACYFSRTVHVDNKKEAAESIKKNDKGLFKVSPMWLKEVAPGHHVGIA